MRGDRNVWSFRWRRSWWWNTWRRKGAETYGRGCPAGVSQYVETMVPGTCPSNRWAMFDAPSVGSSSSVSCDEGLRAVWSRRNPRLRLRGTRPWVGMGGAISHAVVVMSARPALWDELVREHAAVDVSCASCFPWWMCWAGSNVVQWYNDCRQSIVVITLIRKLRVVQITSSWSRRSHQYGGRYRWVDTSLTLTDCLWVLRTALGVVRGTQRIPNCTQWFLLSDWRVASVLGPGVTWACDVVSVMSPAPCARLSQEFSPKCNNFYFWSGNLYIVILKTHTHTHIYIYIYIYISLQMILLFSLQMAKIWSNIIKLLFDFYFVRLRVL
jgi:hypothetical protein